MVPSSYRWEHVRQNPNDIKRLAMETGYPEIFAGMLAARGVSNRSEAEKFLNASAKDMYDPFLMKGMTEAVHRISRAIDQHEKITIYGDYDVDGITSTSILYLFLCELQADVNYYLPDRMSEGYGLNEKAIRTLAEDGTKLIVTVDTGISALKECTLVYELGMDIVITDHHECQPELPKAAAVVDAKQPGETYPFLYMAGCGVAFKVVQGVAKHRNYKGNINQYLELAAVGTVADIVPLYDENRIIVSEGFRRMKTPENLGLYKLLESAGYDFKRRVTSGFIGFGVAPRLNAGGRMGDAARGVRLFTTEDEAEAASIAEELNLENEHRKETEQLILKQVTDTIEASETIRNNRVMVVAGEGWHHGVIGIVSSRIKDAYYRPNILLAVEDGIATGSARSIDGFNLFEALCTCDDLMIKYGGHAAAAGMTLKAENIPELSRRLNAYAKDHMTSDMLVPLMRPEVSLEPSEISIGLIEMIEKMEPFGQNMPEPLVEIKGSLGEVRAVGADGNTMRMKIMDSRSAVTAIGFRRGVLKDYYFSGMGVSIAGNLGINLYMERQYPQIIMKDVHIEQPEDVEHLNRIFALRHITDDYQIYCDQQGKLPSQVCQDVYRSLRERVRRQGSMTEGKMMLEEGVDGLYKMMQALVVFEELGLIRVEASGSYLRYELIEGKKAKLVDSAWYNRYFAI